jgi:uncharacterized protein YeaO (DUF488 family)
LSTPKNNFWHQQNGTITGKAAGGFKRRYKLELRAEDKQKMINGLADKARREAVTLLFAAKDAERNNAAVLQEVLQARIGSGKTA